MIATGFVEFTDELFETMKLYFYTCEVFGSANDQEHDKTDLWYYLKYFGQLSWRIPLANIGNSFLVSEPLHGSAPDAVGKIIANPVASIRSAGMLLGHMKYIS
ncbi:hypothetical protein BY458DRAFT_557757 [Sporodiniella umbellata]|nr:hypothetical protein BY458DRAFT_557757 [Sporodiniella umbellata]